MNLIVDMTPEEQQRAQQMNSAMIKAQADATLQAQKHQYDIDNIDAKAAAQAGLAVVRTNLKHHEQAAQQELEKHGEFGRHKWPITRWRLNTNWSL
jgi:hypothetical protein